MSVLLEFTNSIFSSSSPCKLSRQDVVAVEVAMAKYTLLFNTYPYIPTRCDANE